MDKNNWNNMDEQGSDENTWNSIDDHDFDEILKDSLPEMPPEDIIKDVNPWRKAMKYVLVGMALNTLILNFLNLNLILPAIGVVLMLLGFRTLRRDSKWFKLSWLVSIIRTIYVFSMLIIHATIWHAELFSHPFSRLLIVLNLAFNFLQFFFLWRGFLCIQKKAGLPENAPGAFALIPWYLLLNLLAAIKYQGIIISLGLIITYIFIFRSLFKLSKVLDEAGYVVKTAPVKISDRTLVIAITTFLTIGITCSYLFFNSYPMQWKPVEASTNSEVEEIKENLIELGFPSEILEDLTEEDILACKDAFKVIVYVEDYSINDGRMVNEQYEDYIKEYYVYDNKELNITSIAVALPGEHKHLKLFHHFLWGINPGFYGTETLQLWPTYNHGRGWAESGAITGQVLYNDGDTIYSAPYYSLGSETYTSTGILFEGQTSSDIFATFSMPSKGQQHRGYVSYSIIESASGWIINSWVNYTHQKSWLQYPVRTAMDHRKLGIWGDSEVFRTIQDAMQFFPKY